MVVPFGTAFPPTRQPRFGGAFYRRVAVRRRARYAAGGGGGGFGGLGGGGLGGLSGKMATRKVKRVLVVLMSAFSTPSRLGLDSKKSPGFLR
jgi:hypothetical protein